MYIATWKALTPCRTAFRLHDNPALIAALEPLKGAAADDRLDFRPVFVLDPWFVKNARVGSNRWRFLQESLDDLDSSLRKLGSRLFVLRGNPQQVFEKIFKASLGNNNFNIFLPCHVCVVRL
jgi:cryptochrome